MKKISNVQTDLERAFYGSQDTEFEYINISGPADGESSFKECHNISIKNSNFYLRYPFWHNDKLTMNSSCLYTGCRAAFWYCNDVNISSTFSYGIKGFRECQNIQMKNCSFQSEEIFWRCNNIIIDGGYIDGEYAFFQSNNIQIKQLQFKGKYSFQYVNNAHMKYTYFQTKDAFWHSKDITVEDSTIEGEYLGWYSENLTLIRCRIIGTQPLCYCKNLRLIDCTFERCDLAFENSEVNGNIIGGIDSIKNPLKGTLEIQNEPVFIKDEFYKGNGQFVLKVKKENS